MPLEANVDYSIGRLIKMSEVEDVYELSNGNLKVTTKTGGIFYFKEIIPNHWVRTDSNFSKPYTTDRFS